MAKAVSEGGLVSIETLFILSIIINLFFNDLTLNYALAMMRALQVVIHLPLMHIYLQANLQMVISILIPIIMFDIMESESVAELVLEFDEEQQDLLVDSQYA